MEISKRRTLASGAIALCLLLSVSAWRYWQLSISVPHPLVPYIAYFTYVLLICLWLRSARRRIAQKSMRRFLGAECFIMFFDATVRFVQDAVLVQDMAMLRASGYLLVIPLAFLPLLGFLGSLGLGGATNFRMRKEWWLLAIPACALAALAATDARFHLMFSYDSSGTQPDLLFHPNWGVYLLLGWYAGLTLARIGFLVWRNRRLGVNRHPWLPLIVGLLMLGATVPYFGSAFAPVPDFVEFFARLFVFEALVWESCIASGLVPANTAYADALRSSTLTMQILDRHGERIAGSEDAPTITSDQFSMLRSGQNVNLEDGLQVVATPCSRQTAWCVWVQDMRELRLALRNLESLSEELSQKSDLLSQELRTRSEEERVRSRSDIYRYIGSEIEPQVSRLSALLKELKSTQEYPATSDGITAKQKELLGAIVRLGSELKRTCMSKLSQLDSR